VPGTIEIALDNDIVFAELSLVNGQATYTSGPLTNLSAGNHKLFVDYFGTDNIGYSSTTVSIPYNPGP
jgi:hypothetical protein